MTGIVVF